MMRRSMTCRWIKSLSSGCLFVIALGVGSVAWARGTVITPDLLRIEDAKSWRLINGDCQAATEGGKSVLHLGPKIKATTGSSAALALVEGVEFSEGTLELDLKGRGKIERCFLGVAFNVADGKTFEAVYFRPFNFFRERISCPQVFRVKIHRFPQIGNRFRGMAPVSFEDSQQIVDLIILRREIAGSF